MVSKLFRDTKVVKSQIDGDRERTEDIDRRSALGSRIVNVFSLSC